MCALTSPKGWWFGFLGAEGGRCTLDARAASPTLNVTALGDGARLMLSGLTVVRTPVHSARTHPSLHSVSERRFGDPPQGWGHDMRVQENAGQADAPDYSLSAIITHGVEVRLAAL
jgi:hypothetical protein